MLEWRINRREKMHPLSFGGGALRPIRRRSDEWSICPTFRRNEMWTILRCDEELVDASTNRALFFSKEKGTLKTMRFSRDSLQ